MMQTAINMARCSLKLGLIPAMRVYSPGKIAHVKVPGIAHTLYIRKCFGDRETFREVIVGSYYAHKSLIRANPKLIIDAGAHIGLASVFFANIFPKARILAIEPEHSNFDMLLMNSKKYPNIEPIRSALWHSRTKAEITNSFAETWAFRCSESKYGEIPTITLAELCNGSCPDIIKLDIEGAEKALFEESTLPRPKILVLETHDRIVPGCTEAAMKYCCKFNFNRHLSGNVDIIEFLD